MSKRLPYFQFEPAEYLTGDIMFCSLASQGLFSQICCLYWQRDCKLTFDQAKKRLNNDDLFKELIGEAIIKIQDGYVIINFLDNQHDNASKSSSKNSINGKKGAEKRWGKNSESIALREDKIREDEKKETIINNGTFISECRSSLQWIETIAMQNKIRLETINFLLDNFGTHLIAMQEQKKTLKEFKEHFSHWLRKQDLSNFTIKILGRTNQI